MKRQLEQTGPMTLLIRPLSASEAAAMQGWIPSRWWARVSDVIRVVVRVRIAAAQAGQAQTPKR